ncbi:MAG TPA: DUF1707 domain-containing protein [Streptosporangiaceae bacterium]|jgi:hypothetical protein
MADEAAPQASSGEAVPRGEMRASHEDRDRVVELLRVSAGDGRIDAAELDQRVEAALTARTYNELAALVADLPSAGGTAGAAMGTPSARPKEVVRIECHMGNTARSGRWAVPRRIQAKIVHGNVTLDFTDADIAWPTLQIDAEVVHGNLILVTRPGIVVNTDEVAIHGSNIKSRQLPDTGVPVMLRVDMSGRLQYGNIVVRPPRLPRRTFWQWLTRQPRPPALPSGATTGGHNPCREQITRIRQI